LLEYQGPSACSPALPTQHLCHHPRASALTTRRDHRWAKALQATCVHSVRPPSRVRPWEDSNPFRVKSPGSQGRQGMGFAIITAGRFQVRLRALLICPAPRRVYRRGPSSTCQVQNLGPLAWCCRGAQGEPSKSMGASPSPEPTVAALSAVAETGGEGQDGECARGTSPRTSTNGSNEQGARPIRAVEPLGVQGSADPEKGGLPRLWHPDQLPGRTGSWNDPTGVEAKGQGVLQFGRLTDRAGLLPPVICTEHGCNKEALNDSVKSQAPIVIDQRLVKTINEGRRVAGDGRGPSPTQQVRHGCHYVQAMRRADVLAQVFQRCKTFSHGSGPRFFLSRFAS